MVGAHAPEGGQVGFASPISGGLATAYLADVYALAEHRGRGVGKAIVQRMIE